MLSGLRNHLMDPELTALFCEEYTRHRNKLRLEASATLEGHRAELKRVITEREKLVDAICAGIPPNRSRTACGSSKPFSKAKRMIPF